MNVDRQIRVCAFSHYFPPHFSGAGLYAITLAKEFAKRGVRFIFVTVDNSGLPRKDWYHGFEVHRVADGRLKHGEFILWWNLGYVLYSLKDRYDIIHAFGSTYRNSAIGPIGKILGKKSLTTVSMANNDLQLIAMRTWPGRLQGRFLGFVDRYISLSQRITEEIRDLPLDCNKAVEIPQGVDHDRFRPADESEKSILRHKLQLPKTPIALYVGVFDGRKNVRWLVETWADNSGFVSPWSLVLVGPASRDRRDSGLRESLQAFVSERGLEKRIMFREFSPTIEEYYRAADIFILPSQNEGMPNVVVEAMASGLPCVVTSISGTTDLVQHEQTGMLFEVNSGSSFLSALGAVTRCHEKRHAFGVRARQVSVERYSTEKIATRYLDLYREMLSKAR